MACERKQHPEPWKQVDEKAKTQPAHLLALRCSRCSARSHASVKKWQELNEKILMHEDNHELCLVSIKKGSRPHRMTDTVLTVEQRMISVSSSRTVYLKILATMKKADEDVRQRVSIIFDQDLSIG
jgi:hypothetical protein